MKVESRLRVDRDQRFLVASFGITSFRFVLACFGAGFILSGDLWFSASLIASIMMLDYFDGAIFAKSSFSDSETWRKRRRVFDSVVDRLAIQIICIPLALKNPSFAWLYVPIATREVLISGYLSKAYAEGLVVYPRSVAKLACAVVGLSVISFIAFPIPFTFICAAVMIALSVFALLDYRRRVQEYEASNPIRLPNGSREEIF